MSRITVLKRCILYTIKRSEISHFLQHSLTILEVLLYFFQPQIPPRQGGRMRAVFFKDCSQEVFGNAR